MNIEPGIYRIVDWGNESATVCERYVVGPFLTPDHAWCHAYANDELDERKSDRKKQYMVNRKGEFMGMRKHTDILDCLNDDELKHIHWNIIPVHFVKYPELLKNGLLSL